MERRSLYETWPADPHAPPLEAGEALFFDAEVRPNRSLPNPGFMALMIAIGVLSFTAGIAFMLMGAWPVLGFFGLDVLLVWLAFRFSYREGRRVETIQVTPREIRVARRSPFGHLTAFRIPAAFTRVEIVGRGEPDVQARLAHAGKHLIIGSMLAPKEREALAEALQEAVRTALRQGARTPAQEPGGAPA
jgi:uncharacterized membrane protein